MPIDTDTLPLPLNDPNRDTGAADSWQWLDTDDLAELAKISRQAAWKAATTAAAGRTWRGAAMTVRQVPSVGGKSGQAYQVFIPSLPSNLAQAWKDQHPERFKTIEAPRVRLDISARDAARKTDPKRFALIEKGELLEALIKPALLYLKGSHARAEIVRGICATMPVTFPSGYRATINERGITRLIAKYESGGLSALIHSGRADDGASRVIVSRSFDKTAPFNEAELREIWADLSRYIKDMILGTHFPLRQIERLAGAHLVGLARARGWAEASLQNCQVGISQVRKFKELRVAAMKTLDAGKFADHFKPRVIRGRRGLQPMEIVMGDVHPVDILNVRDDGSEATARMVSWLDLATNRVFYNLFLFEKGKSITQADVAYSFVQMVRAWGLPGILYLDNGSEYIWKEMMEGFKKIAWLADSFRAYVMNSDEIEQRIEHADNEESSGADDMQRIVRSLPNNPPGKAPKEGLFGVLERTVLCGIPGWIGGDRMDKKTHKVGQKPRAYRGTWAQFQSDFKTAIEYYHCRPQKDGSSPNEKFDQHVKAGWQAVDVDYVVLAMSFSERKLYKIQNTGIEVAGAIYWHDMMASPYLMGGKVLVYYAKWDADQIIVLPTHSENGQAPAPVVAYRAREFGIVEKSGAIESGRRMSLMNKGVREMKQGSSRVDAVGEMGKFAQLSPSATVVPFGPKITVPKEFEGILEAAEQAGEPPKVEHVRLLPGQWFDRETGTVRSMYEQTGEPEAEPVDDFEALERAAYIQQGRDAAAAEAAQKEDQSGSRLTGHDQ